MSTAQIAMLTALCVWGTCSAGQAAETRDGVVEVYRNPRPDGRCESTYWATYHQLKTLKPHLAYDPGLSPRQFRKWQTKVRRKLKELVAFPDVGEQPAPRQVSSEPRDGYELQRWECYPEPFVVYPFFVLVPDGVSPDRPGPAVLCCPGSLGTKESLAGEPEHDGTPGKTGFPEHNCMALHYARAGLVAVATDNLHNGALGAPAPTHSQSPREDALWHQFWMGKNEEGLNVFYRSEVLRWLKGWEWVNQDRIAVSGHSLGAKHTLILGVLDPKIKAVVYNDSLVHWRDRQVAEPLKHLPFSHMIPGFANWFDYRDLWAALAPIPLLVTEGGRTADIDVVRGAYAKLNAQDAFRLHHYPKYDSPEKRLYDNKPLPDGIDAQTYFEYANVDPPDHYFKDRLAVPWLSSILAGPVR